MITVPTSDAKDRRQEEGPGEQPAPTCDEKTQQTIKRRRRRRRREQSGAHRTGFFWRMPPETAAVENSVPGSLMSNVTRRARDMTTGHEGNLRRLVARRLSRGERLEELKKVEEEEEAREKEDWRWRRSLGRERTRSRMEEADEEDA
jgi:hypothetical protein